MKKRRPGRQPGFRLKVTPELENRIRLERMRGATLASIAGEFGLHVQTVRLWLGLDPRTSRAKGHRPDPESGPPTPEVPDNRPPDPPPVELPRNTPAYVPAIGPEPVTPSKLEARLASMPYDPDIPVYCEAAEVPADLCPVCDCEYDQADGVLTEDGWICPGCA